MLLTNYIFCFVQTYKTNNNINNNKEIMTCMYARCTMWFTKKYYVYYIKPFNMTSLDVNGIIYIILT